ncbi:MAG TPA: NUDIX hydrolase [Mycobacterium sp.]|nr:NUDIX hydrolase [Mycobacterium sp.]
MSDTAQPLTSAEYESIYSRVPRLTVEIVLRDAGDRVLLTKRAIAPCAGQWHLPGGTVFFGESLLEAVRRIAARELGIEVREARSNGYIEYPSHYRNGLDSPVGIVFEVSEYAGELRTNHEAADGRWFSRLPHGIHADQDEYLISHGYLRP